jgi:hypothetical protein
MNNAKKIEENKRKRKLIVDNWLKAEKPLEHVQEQRVDNFEMLMAFCTLIKRQRPLLSKQSVDQITSMIDVVYNGISIDDGNVYLWKARNGAMFLALRLLILKNWQLAQDAYVDRSALSLNGRTLAIRENRANNGEGYKDVLNVFDMRQFETLGEKMRIIEITNDVNNSPINQFKISPNGLYLIAKMGLDVYIYDIYQDSQPAITKLTPMYGKWVFDICESDEGALVAFTLHNYSFKVSSFTFGKNKPTEKFISKCSIVDLMLVIDCKIEYISQLAFVGDGKHIIAATNSLDVVCLFDYVTSTMKVKMENYATRIMASISPHVQCVARGIDIDRDNNLARIRLGVIYKTSSNLIKEYYSTPNSYYAVNMTSGKIVFNLASFDHYSYRQVAQCVNNNNVIAIVEHDTEHNESLRLFRRNYYSFLQVSHAYSKKVVDVIAGDDFLFYGLQHVYESFD